MGVLAPILLVSIHITKNPMFSPIDEINHFDYVTRLAGGGFPRLGQDIQPSSLQVFECTGIAHPSVRLPACGTLLNRQVRGALTDALPEYEVQQPPS